MDLAYEVIKSLKNGDEDLIPVSQIIDTIAKSIKNEPTPPNISNNQEQSHPVDSPLSISLNNAS